MERLPTADAALGRGLFELLSTALGRGLPRPAMMVLRADEVMQFDVVPLLGSPDRVRRRMLAAIAGQEGVECVAMIGVLRVGTRKGGPTSLAASVYLEWPNNRWWTAWQPLGSENELLGDAPRVRHAIDGWPRPNGIGGWFAQARRERLRLRVERPGHQAGMGLVH